MGIVRQYEESPLPPIVLALLLKFGSDVWLAGGSVRKAFHREENVSDYDLFFKNMSTCEQVSEWVEQQHPDNTLVRCSAWADTHKCDGNELQLVVSKFPESAEALFSTFDLEMSKWAYQITTYGPVVTTTEGAQQGVIDKILEMAAVPESPIHTLLRIMKFNKKEGYYLPISEAYNFLKSVVDNPQLLEDDLLLKHGSEAGSFSESDLR
jgi:hypothetical protein